MEGLIINGRLPILSTPTGSSVGHANATRYVMRKIMDSGFDPLEWNPDDAWYSGQPVYFCAICEVPISEARFEEVGICRECAVENKAEFAKGIDPDNLAGRDLEDVG